MASEWIERRIGELGRIVTGKTPSTSDPSNFGGPYPFITILILMGGSILTEPLVRYPRRPRKT
jgi:type I restriction enzyme S subunit